MRVVDGGAGGADHDAMMATTRARETRCLAAAAAVAVVAMAVGAVLAGCGGGGEEDTRPGPDSGTDAREDLPLDDDAGDAADGRDADGTDGLPVDDSMVRATIGPEGGTLA